VRDHSKNRAVTAYVRDDTLTVLPIHHSAGLHSSIVRARSATVLGHALLGLSSWITLTPDQTP
jgi:hypothetical protein